MKEFLKLFILRMLKCVHIPVEQEVQQSPISGTIFGFGGPTFYVGGTTFCNLVKNATNMT